MQLNINLTPQLDELVRAKVSSGLYNSASEVVRQALRLMEQEDQMRAARPSPATAGHWRRVNSGSAGALDVNAIKQRGRQRLAAQKLG